MARHQEHRQLWLGILLLTAAQLRGPAEAVSAAAAGPPAAGQTAGGQNTTQAAEEGGTKPELPAETGQSPPRGTVSGVSAQQAAALKPAFHITGAHGWINDPNGMFQRNGTFHIFYQVAAAESPSPLPCVHAIHSWKRYLPSRPSARGSQEFYTQ